MKPLHTHLLGAGKSLGVPGLHSCETVVGELRPRIAASLHTEW